MSDEGVFSRGKRIVEAEKQVEQRKPEEAANRLNEAREKLTQTLASLSSLTKTVPGVPGGTATDVHIVDGQFVQKLTGAMTELGNAYNLALEEALKKYDDVKGDKQAALGEIERISAAATVDFERVLGLLESIDKKLTVNLENEALKHDVYRRLQEKLRGT